MFLSVRVCVRCMDAYCCLPTGNPLEAGNRGQIAVYSRFFVDSHRAWPQHHSMLVCRGWPGSHHCLDHMYAAQLHVSLQILYEEKGMCMCYFVIFSMSLQYSAYIYVFLEVLGKWETPMDWRVNLVRRVVRPLNPWRRWVHCVEFFFFLHLEFCVDWQLSTCFFCLFFFCFLVFFWVTAHIRNCHF